MGVSYAIAFLSAILTWAGILAFCLAEAIGDPLPRLDHPAVILSARACVAYWFAAVGLMLRLRPGEWRVLGWRVRLARMLWTLGIGIYLGHMLFAIGFAHGWSHAAAIRHVADRGGSGEAIAVNYVFGLVWAADAVWWWLSPGSYSARSWRWRVVVHGFMTFIIFNATVVFGPGPVAVVCGIGVCCAGCGGMVAATGRSGSVSASGGAKGIQVSAAPGSKPGPAV